MEFNKQVEFAADIIWIRLHAKGGMMLHRLRSLLKMDRSLFNQGIGWLAKEGKISVTKTGWGKRIRLCS